MSRFTLPAGGRTVRAGPVQARPRHGQAHLQGLHHWGEREWPGKRGGSGACKAIPDASSLRGTTRASPAWNRVALSRDGKSLYAAAGSDGRGGPVQARPRHRKAHLQGLHHRRDRERPARQRRHRRLQGDPGRVLGRGRTRGWMTCIRWVLSRDGKSLYAAAGQRRRGGPVNRRDRGHGKAHLQGLHHRRDRERPARRRRHRRLQGDPGRVL